MGDNMTGRCPYCSGEKERTVKVPGCKPAGKSPVRPFAPETLRESIKKVTHNYRSMAGKKPTTASEKKQLGLLAGKLAEPFGRGKAAEQSRHLAIDWLFSGKTSANDLDMAEISACLYWLLGERGDDGKYPYKPHAVEELKAIVAAQMEAAGQLSLDAGDEPGADNPHAMPQGLEDGEPEPVAESMPF